MKEVMMYQCGFCKKTYEKQSSCRSHQRHCPSNPERVPYEGEISCNEIYLDNGWIFIGKEIADELSRITLWHRKDFILHFIEREEEKRLQFMTDILSEFDARWSPGLTYRRNHPKNNVRFMYLVYLMYRVRYHDKYGDDFSYERVLNFRERIWKRLLGGKKEVWFGPLVARELDEDDIGLKNGCYGYTLHVEIPFVDRLIWRDDYL